MSHDNGMGRVVKKSTLIRTGRYWGCLRMRFRYVLLKFIDWLSPKLHSVYDDLEASLPTGRFNLWTVNLLSEYATKGTICSRYIDLSDCDGVDFQVGWTSAENRSKSDDYVTPVLESSREQPSIDYSYHAVAPDDRIGQFASIKISKAGKDSDGCCQRIGYVGDDRFVRVKLVSKRKTARLFGVGVVAVLRKDISTRRIRI